MTQVSGINNNIVPAGNNDISTQTNSGMNKSIPGMIEMFNTITTNMLFSISINNVNTKSSENPAAVSAAISGGQTISTSSDGKLASPISKPVINSIPVDDSIADKIDNNGNTIKLGKIAYKDVD